jgi:hydrogenase/urease accessory protein HupE
MPLALRWLSLLFLLFAAARAHAHPILEDSLHVTLSANAIELEVRSTLRPVVVAVGATPQQGSAFAPAEMAALVQAHTAYLERHLSLRVNDQLLAAREAHAELIEPLSEPVQAHADLERWHARFLLTYPLHGAITRLSLEQDLLRDSPSDRSWRESYVVSVRQAGNPAPLATGLLTPERGFDFALSRAREGGPARDVPHDFTGYFLAGIRHILNGWDHLLFVSALVLATRRFVELIRVVLAFTIAHSFTLTLAVLHWVHLSAAVVEPLIALSIVAVSLENLVRPARGASATRLAVAFGFGLVHGLGFAGPLVAALQGAPASAIAVGIVGFSLGVELGHQLVVLPLFLAATQLARTTHDRSFPFTLRVGSLLTALGGAFFLIRALETFVFS